MAMETIAVLGAVGTALKIVDSLTGQWDRYFRKKSAAEVAQVHSVQATQVAPDTISVRDHGQEQFTITAADMAKLDPQSRALIKTFEASMERRFELWQKVYPQRDSSSDAMVNAKLDLQLRDLATGMCGDLGKIFQYLDSIGARLNDHYNHARFICDELAAGRL
jgi:hypothetical protein